MIDSYQLRLGCSGYSRLCRGDRTQFYRDDGVAAVVLVVSPNRMSVSIWSSQSDDRYERDDYMEIRFN